MITTVPIWYSLCKAGQVRERNYERLREETTEMELQALRKGS